MTGPEYPDAPPPEVPEEFAAAYREAYQRALESGPDQSVSDPGQDTGHERGVDPAYAPAPVAAEPEVVSAQQPEQLVPRSGEAVGPVARWRASRWFLVSVLTAGALVLVAAAYAVGTTFSGSDDPGATGTVVPQSSRTTSPARSGSPTKATPTRESTKTAPDGWEGKVEAISVDAIAADCTAPPSSDSAGNKVTYVPENATDDETETAWRCSGTAVGQKLTLRLSEETDVAEVGLVPGYAKTDPDSGADRYAENNRITKVRWTFGDGVSVVQKLDPDPSSRALQLLRVPRTTTDTVTLEILKVKRGPRNTTAISDIRLAEAA